MYLDCAQLEMELELQREISVLHEYTQVRKPHKAIMAPTV